MKRNQMPEPTVEYVSIPKGYMVWRIPVLKELSTQVRIAAMKGAAPDVCVVELYRHRRYTRHRCEEHNICFVIESAPMPSSLPGFYDQAREALGLNDG
jgi:hypothetical protein